MVAMLNTARPAPSRAETASTCPVVTLTSVTVPVGTGKKIQEIVQRVRPDLTIHVASNPEFLREGNAIGDFMRPDRVVLGAEGDAAFAVLRRLYRPLYLIETPIVATSIETAELIKYAANAFLATKITFINEIADLCEKVGADVHDVARGMGLDGRIGRKFLHAGPGYGGSCFPKDTLALAMTARDAGSPVRLVETTIAVNDARKEAMADRIIAALGGDVAGKSIGILGVTFKPETDDMRDAPSLVILPKLVAAGAKVTVHDPQPHQARQALPGAVTFAATPMEAVAGADAVALLTEWNESRSMAPERLCEAMRGKVVLDLRNAWDPEAMREAGLDYSGIGRP
jgi:UDPglucose 6-dehydrogenase